MLYWFNGYVIYADTATAATNWLMVLLRIRNYLHSLR